MLEIDALSKTAVYDVMKELLYSVNYMYAKLEELLRDKYPEELESEEFYELQKKTGAYEARRLSSILDISVGDVDDLIRLLRYSLWAVFENLEIEKLNEKSFKMRIIDCSWQKAIKKRGMDYYDCRLLNYLLLSGFLEQTNRNARVERIFSPPEKRPVGTTEDVSCEWLISIEDQ